MQIQHWIRLLYTIQCTKTTTAIITKTTAITMKSYKTKGRVDGQLHQTKVKQRQNACDFSSSSLFSELQITPHIFPTS